VRAVGGTGSRALDQPFGVAVSSAGVVWVTDRGRGRVSAFTPAGRLITAFGGHGAGALADPGGLAVDSGDHIWVADTGRDAVVEFSARGAQLAVIGSPGAGQGQLNAPSGVAVARSGALYVADQGNNRVDEFSASGRYLMAFRVSAPRGIAIDAAGHVWVSSAISYVDNADYNQIREFAADGRRLQAFGITQSSYGGLSDPAGIAVTTAGLIYVAQPDFGWVTVFGPHGRFVTEFGLQSSGDAGQNLRFPADVAVGRGGQVWVADSGNSRIVEYAPRGSAPKLPLPGAARPSGLSGTALLTAVLTAVLAALAVAGAIALLSGKRSRPAAPGTLAAPSAQAAMPAAGPAGPAVGRFSLGRRQLLAGAAALTGAGLGASLLPRNLLSALAATPAAMPRARLGDIKHIVILMQENRSFDHYYGTMPGARGFADKSAIRLPGGNPVFYQPDRSHAQGYLLPFHYDTKTTSAQATPGLDHQWPSQHRAWAGGKMDGWIAAKGPHTMGYYTRDDIPFHWALAEAFTLCDNYHCSVLGPTDPNRLHMMTGTVDPGGTHGGPVTGDAPAFRPQVLSWITYPERLEQAGISWQVYQEEDNYDDNALAWFRQYQNAPTSSPLYQRGMARWPTGKFEADARADRLPQVSWLVAPAAQSEHPDFLPAAGAEYIAQKLDAIAANPDVWAKTAFILCYDENDGQFDHVPPPTPPPGTPGEFIRGEPIGLGFRTATTIVSPWTAGGFVCSEVLDHTSLIRLIESRFGVQEPQISAWRRRTCGDLTAAFRFSGRSAGYPHGNTRLRLTAAESGLLTAQREVQHNPAPAIPAVNQPLPRQ
jgi:phospholipase C